MAELLGASAGVLLKILKSLVSRFLCELPHPSSSCRIARTEHQDMDPFTVVGTLGATVNILEASVRLSHGLMRTIQTWKNAPDEILVLNNTIAVFSVLLERVKETCLIMEQSDHDSGTARFHAVLDYQLRASESSLTKLSDYAEQLVVGRKAVQRTRWIKLRSAVKEDTRRLREMHSTIDSILTSYIAYVESSLSPIHTSVRSGC